MSRRTLVFLAILVTVALGAVWLLELTWERAIYLAPVIVICSLAVTALIVLWAGAVAGRGRPGRVVRRRS